MEILFWFLGILAGYTANVFLARWLNYLLYKMVDEEIDTEFWFYPISALWNLGHLLIVLFNKFSYSSPWFNGEYWSLPSGMIPFNSVTCPVNETFEFFSKKDSDAMVGYLNAERTHVIYDKPSNPTKIGYRDIKRVKYYKIR